MATTTWTVARAGALGVAVGVLLLAALLGTAQPAGAAPITTTADGWTPENFLSSCKQAGGKGYEIDQGDIHYSYCKFPDGSRNRCDWIKKTCTFGEELRPGGMLGGVRATGGDQATADGGGGTTTGTVGGVNVVVVGGVLVADDEDGGDRR